MSTRTKTILVTDVVGSAHLVPLGEEVADEFHRSHGRLLLRVRGAL